MRFPFLLSGWESLHLYTHNGFLVPLAAVRIINNMSHLYKEKNTHNIYIKFLQQLKFV